LEEDSHDQFLDLRKEAKAIALSRFESIDKNGLGNIFEKDAMADYIEYCKSQGHKARLDEFTSFMK
jgi:hypothetical protein